MIPRPNDLPEFDDPPVAEVLMGFQFGTEHPLQAVHVGPYWQLIRDVFTRHEQQPPLHLREEDFAESSFKAMGAELQLLTGAPPLPRFWFLDDSGNRLIQLQQQMFLHNWRKVSGVEEYPRFETIWKEFDHRWQEFRKFLSDTGLGKPRTTVAELTYVNHLQRGRCWEDMSDAQGLFNFAVERQPAFLPVSESFTWSGTFVPRSGAGRLHVEVGPAILTRDNTSIFRFVLTARGPVGAGENEQGETEKWFHEARQWIVRGFTDLTSARAHKLWKRKK